MPTLKGRIPDSLSTAASAGTGIGSIGRRTKREVRAAQLVVASHANDAGELRELLRMLGIYNREGKIQEECRASRKPSGAQRVKAAKRAAYNQPSQRDLPRDFKFPGEREPNGRRSRKKVREVSEQGER